MKKSRGVLVLALTAIVTALLIFTSAVGVSGQEQARQRTLRPVLDLSGGVSITYQASKKSPTEDEMADTIYKLQKRVEQYSTEATGL